MGKTNPSCPFYAAGNGILQWLAKHAASVSRTRILTSLLGVLLSSEHDVGHDNAVHLDSGCSTVVRS